MLSFVVIIKNNYYWLFFLTEVDEITKTSYSRELNVLCGDANIDLLTLKNIGNSYGNMKVS